MSNLRPKSGSVGEERPPKLVRLSQFPGLAIPVPSSGTLLMQVRISTNHVIESKRSE